MPGDRFGCVSFSPNGGVLVGRARGGSDPKEPPTSAAVTLWSTEFKKETDFELQLSPGQYLSEGKFSPDGRFVKLNSHSMGGIVWDLGVRPPRCIDDELGLVHAAGYFQAIEFSPTGDRVSLENRSGPRDAESFSRLAALPSLAPVPLEDDQRQHSLYFSPSGRWLTGSGTAKERQISWAEQMIRRHLSRWLPPVPRYEVVLWDAQTGRVFKRIPGDRVVAWSPDDSSVWVASTNHTVRQSDTTFSKWPVPTSYPWWLWLVTAAGAVAIVWDVRRTWKRRPSASGVA
ncbi:MAG: hypothetical protein ACJ8C4_21650 [Gemmataceae bacterium]